MPKKASHTVYRDSKGVLIPKTKADRLPKDKFTKEQMPNPGHGDTGRGGKKASNALELPIHKVLRWMTENLEVASGIYRTKQGGIAVDPALNLDGQKHPVRNASAGKPANHEDWFLNSACGLLACCYMDALGKAKRKGQGKKWECFDTFVTDYMDDFMKECTAKGGKYSLATLRETYRNPFVHQFAAGNAVWGRNGRTADYWFLHNGEVAINIDRLVAGTVQGVQAFKTWCDAEIKAGNAKAEDFMDWLDKN